MRIAEICLLPAFAWQHVKQHDTRFFKPRRKNVCVGSITPKRRRSVGDEEDQPPRAVFGENTTRHASSAETLNHDGGSGVGVDLLVVPDSQPPGLHDAKRSRVPEKLAQIADCL